MVRLHCATCHQAFNKYDAQKSIFFDYVNMFDCSHNKNFNIYIIGGYIILVPVTRDLLDGNSYVSPWKLP